MKLFGLTTAYQNLLELAAEGEDFSAAIDELRGDIAEKAENYAFVIKALEAEEDAIKETVKELQAKVQHRANAVERIKNHLKAGLEDAGIDKVKGRVYTVALQNSPPSVEVLDVMQCPAVWLRASVTLPYLELPESLREQASIIVDKKAALEAWRDGDAGDGVAIIQNRHIRIR